MYSSSLLHGIPYYSFPPHWGPATVIFPFSQAPKTPSVLVSYGYITYHHKFGNTKQYHSLPYSSIGQKSKQDQLGSLFRFPWGQNQHGGQAELLSAGSGFESASSLIQDVDWIQFLAVIDLRSLFLAGSQPGASQLLKAACVSSHLAPSSFRPARGLILLTFPNLSDDCCHQLEKTLCL